MAEHFESSDIPPTSSQNVFRRSNADHHRPKRGSVPLVTVNHTHQTVPSIAGCQHTDRAIIVILGTDTSQGKGQIISNINACQAVQATIKSTLGPYGGDLLMIDENGRQTITNDGATVMKARRDVLRVANVAMLTSLPASRHRPPRRPNPRRHCQVARCRGWRRNHVGGCAGRRNLERGQRTRRARCQFTSHHQGFAESVYDGRQ